MRHTAVSRSITWNRGKFSAEEIELATTVGDQTALAIENARLRTQVERTAVAEERSRIARATCMIP